MTGPFIHPCIVCGAWGSFGHSPKTKRVADAVWWCAEHVPDHLRDRFRLPPRKREGELL